MTTHVDNCPRFGNYHYNVQVNSFAHEPSAVYTHWAMCPLAGEPILITVYEDGPKPGPGGANYGSRMG